MSMVTIGTSMEDSPEAMEVDMELEKPGNGRKLSRGEKSRIAAKFRRDKENVAMNNLIRELPVNDETLKKMDKTSVIRLAICYLKIKHFVQKDMQSKKRLPPNGVQALTEDGGNTENTESMFGVGEGQLMLEGLNGFLIFVNKKGIIRFCSQSVNSHLGLKQENLIGRSVMEIVHINDQAEIMKHFRDADDKETNTKDTQAISEDSDGATLDDNPQIVFYIRMKYNLIKPGSKTRQSGHMLVQWSGKMKQHLSSKTGTMVMDGLLCICRPMQTTPLVEIRMDGNMFMSRHDLGMTFTFCDTRIITLIGYEPNELIGKTAYHFHNPIDAPKVSDCHQNLIVKGTSVSKYYRFLGKTNNWVWLQTRATIIYNTNNKPQYIVCMNYVISEEEGERYLMLEEHKHANTHADNVCLTLPDNQQPFSFPFPICPPSTGPQIIELCDENLEKTACLNGELDQPPGHTDCKQQPAPSSATSLHAAPDPDYSRSDPYHSLQHSYHLDLDQHVKSSSSAGNKPSPVTQHVTKSVQRPYVQASEYLQQTAAASGQCSGTVEPLGHDIMVCPSPDSSISTMSPAAHDLYGGQDKPISNVYTSLPGSCQSIHSCSEDGGYESATSPYSSSYMSPSMVSPSSYSCSVASDRGFTPDTNISPAMIQGQNCNFGVGYQGSNPNLSSACANSDTRDFFANDSSNPQIPEAETILDELLKSFNNQTPSDNLDVNMSAVYSTIENFTNPNSPTLYSSVKSPTLVNTPPPPSPATSEKGKERSLLRSFLTMPEDDIPKQPLLFAGNSEKNSKCGSLPKEACKKHCTGFCCRNSAAKKILSANSIQVKDSDKCCSKPSCNAQSPVSRCQGQPDDLDFSEMPDDISDFALQYLDSMTDAQAQAVIEDLNSDSFMDTSESDITKEFLNSLESQCTSTSKEQLSTFSVNTSSQFGCDPKTVIGQFHPNGQSGVCQQSMSIQDHGYYQSLQRNNGQHSAVQRNSGKHLVSHRNNGHSKAHSNKTSRSSGPSNASFSHSHTQTIGNGGNERMSELERVLRCNLDENMFTFQGAKQPYVSSPRPFLQQLLTGELTKDKYMEMEEQRCGRGRGVTPR